jgi:DNA repair exonuclease SbcCD nuclease subunit
MIIFTDLQLHNYNSVYGDSCINLGLDALRQIREYAVKSGDKEVACLGDVFHLKDRIPTIVWNSLFSELEKWSEAGINSIWMRGNHDFQTEESLRNFKLLKNTFIALKPMGYIDAFAITYFFMPYGYENHIVPPSTDVLLFHNFFKNIDYGFETDVNIDTKKLRKKIKYIFAGHNHKFIEVEKGRAWHVGSPYQVSFSEVNQQKYFAVVNDKGVKFLKFKHPKLIQLDYSGNIPEDLSNSYIKLIVEVKSLSNFSIKKVKQDLIKRGALGVKIEMVYKPETKARMTYRRGKGIKNMDDYDYVDSYIKNIDFDKTIYDESTLKFAGKEIITSCK